MKLKRAFLIIPFLSSFFLLTNCNKLPDKVNTLYGIEDTNERTLQNIAKSDLESYMEDKKTFILVQLTSTCHCSQEFEAIVKEYIKETGLLIYSVDYTQVKDTNLGFTFRDNRPTFHVVLKGKNLGNLEKYNSEDFFSNKDVFKSFMDKHIAKPSIFKVTKDELDGLFTNDDPFAIYYAKSKCSECEYFNINILNDYAQSHMNMKKMYYIDLATETITKEDYGLTDTSKWGYKSGAIPTIHYVEPKDTHQTKDSTKQAFMFGNDILDVNYKISESFYSETRVKDIRYANITSPINRQYAQKDSRKDGDYTVLNNEKSDELYRDIAYKFMDYIQTKLS